MLINTVRMVDYDQSKEHAFGDDNSLKENLAIGLLNPDDYEKLNITPNLNLKLVNEHGQVIIKIKIEKNVPLGTILMPVSIWSNQIIGIHNGQISFKNIEVNVETTQDNVLDIKGLLKTAVEKDASDLFLKVGSLPHLKIDGKLCPEGTIPLNEEDLNSAVENLMTEEKRTEFKRELEIDFAFEFPELGRFRISIFTQKTSPCLVFRPIKSKSLSFEELNLPAEVLKKLSFEQRGLVLITGATGSGKSTTIASMIEYINLNMARHILTIEEPIEFVFEDKKSIINQREIDMDTSSYTSALHHSMFQSPDVIFIGNIRDRSTMWAALTAAETGQFVVSTLHSINASETIERIVNFFPSHQHQEVRVELSLLLKSVISLRLIPRKDAQGRIPAYEIMLLTPTMARLIREGKTNEIPRFIESGTALGMQTFDQSVVKLYREGKIGLEETKTFADNPGEVELRLKGIERISEEGKQIPPANLW